MKYFESPYIILYVPIIQTKAVGNIVLNSSLQHYYHFKTYINLLTLKRGQWSNMTGYFKSSYATFYLLTNTHGIFNLNEPSRTTKNITTHFVNLSWSFLLFKFFLLFELSELRCFSVGLGGWMTDPVVGYLPNFTVAYSQAVVLGWTVSKQPWKLRVAYSSRFSRFFWVYLPELLSYPFIGTVLQQ